MSITHCQFIGLCNTYELDPLFVKIFQYPQVVHSHGACTDYCNSHLHKATTSLAIVARSS
jgi:hypothetical protein